MRNRIETGAVQRKPGPFVVRCSVGDSPLVTTPLSGDTLCVARKGEVDSVSASTEESKVCEDNFDLVEKEIV